jgi:hypothetical protein
MKRGAVAAAFTRRAGLAAGAAAALGPGCGLVVLTRRTKVAS